MNCLYENATYQELKKYIDDLPEKSDDQLIRVLHHAQGLFGYLPKEVQQFVGKEMNIPVSKIYGVITFYSFFRMQPIGEYSVSVCMGTGCFVKGSQNIMEQFKTVLKIQPGETTEDGMFTLSDVRCIGACGLAPVVTINEDVHGNLKVDQVRDIISDYLTKSEVTQHENTK